jgi:hypothetical protein
MERRDQEIIDRITTVRMTNNQLWMKLVEIALEHAPEQTRGVLRDIRSNDARISDLMKDLAGW